MTLIVSPPPRWSAVMAELPTSSVLVLFGGKTTANLYNGNVAYSGLLNDTWTWNGTAWTSISTGFTTSGATTTLNGPPPRFEASMSYDGTFVTMVGGANSVEALTDTWSYSTGGGWAQQPIVDTNTGVLGPAPSYNVFTTPTSLRGASMAYQSGPGKAVLFGGTATYQRHYVLDTWLWTTGSPGSWSSVSPAAWPNARMYAAMASNATTAVMFGGKNFDGALSDTWTWNGTTWTKVAASGPSARYGASMVYDANTSSWLLFGGVTGNGYAFDTWSFNGTTWTNVSVGTPGLGAPLGRAFASMAYHTATTSVVMFGGVNSTVDMNDTWVWNGTTWTKQ